MRIIGINAAFHDSAAAIIEDGVVLAAAEEERFTRIKHGKRPIPFSTYELPFHAIAYCLEHAGVTLNEVDAVAYSFDPYLLLDPERSELILPLEPSAVSQDSPWEGLFLSSIVNAPRHLHGGAPHHLFSTIWGSSREPRYEWRFVDHHLSHAASAFWPSPFEEAAVLVLDGRGERVSTSYYVGDREGLERIGEVILPHSLGLLYERVTEYLGFLHSSDEYKVMALASFGTPRFGDLFREVIEVKDQGQYLLNELNLREKFGSPRRRGEPLEQKHFDIASSLQVVLEESVLSLVRWLRRETGLDNLCMAGGVALNCVMNGRIKREGGFSSLWIQPAAGDAGTALGAALQLSHEKRPTARFRMSNAYLGSEYSNEEIESFLKWAKVSYRRSAEIALDTATLLADDKIIGWFQGRMEFGPRALGARSILASPISPTMQAKLNEIKDREDFRPVAPVVLREKASEWFEECDDSPYMLLVFNVKEAKRDRIPAVCHTDGSARVQTVTEEENPLYHLLLREFEKQTHVPILVNTSFNTRGNPIVCSPKDAIEAFFSSPLDALVIGSFIVEK